MTQKQSLNEIIRQSQIICSALILGQLFFLAIAIYLIIQTGMGFGDVNMKDVFIYVVPSFAAISIAASFFVFKSKLSKLKESQTLDQKLVEYRSAQIIRWALLEGPSFFAIIVFLLTGQYLFVGIVAIIILFFIPTFPSANSFEQDLELTWEEKNQLGE
ncbi:MAG TPA: hypothetical protein DIW31_09735 [Bacteroidales bacterium]|nr:hypothetical protein [Bacteroidales bacterium]